MSGVVSYDCKPSPFAPYRIRSSIITWVTEEGCSHALTLNPNREVTFDKLRKMFGRFCLEIDRLRNDKKRVAALDPSHRLFAVAFPEHLSTNPHLHLAARFDGWWKGPLDRQAERSMWLAWRRITSGAGSICLKHMHDPAGWGEYITKEYKDGAGEYLLSHDFHGRW